MTKKLLLLCLVTAVVQLQAADDRKSNRCKLLFIENLRNARLGNNNPPILSTEKEAKCYPHLPDELQTAAIGVAFSQRANMFCNKHSSTYDAFNCLAILDLANPNNHLETNLTPDNRRFAFRPNKAPRNRNTTNDAI